MARLPLITPDIHFDEVVDDFRAIFESGRLTSGPYVRRFEETVATMINMPHAIAVTSATTAMHLALAAGDVGPGDEVLVSDFTYPATANVVHFVGAKPVLVDCTEGRFDMDPTDARAKLTSRTKAILFVDPFGQPARHAELKALATEHGLLLIEDAACALGASRDGQPCGSDVDFSCFSFHPRKIVTTGEGGIVACRNEEHAARMLRLRNHGGVAGEAGIEFIEPGFNFRMCEVQAAIGLPQLGRFDGIMSRRRELARWYLEALEGAAGLHIPLAAEVDECTFQSFVVMLEDDINRLEITRTLLSQDIETTLGTYSVHAHPAFASYGYKPGDLPQSWRNQRQSLTLPLAYWMSREDVQRAVDALQAAIASQRSQA
jgi:dTDP-4-amino-4,6-dideoxygalactose transaminase